MGHQDEETDGHGRIGLRELGMRAVEELIEGDEVAIRLAHLLSVDGDHVVVHPIVYSRVALGGAGLRNLALVVREEQVETSTVDVKLLTQVLLAHGRALKVPTWESFAPGRWPMHDVFGSCLLPKGEIASLALLALSVEFARGVNQLVDVAARKDAVVELLGILLHVEIDAAVRDVGKACIKNLLHIGNLLDDVARSVWLDAGWQHVQRLHGLVVAVHVVLHHFHRLLLLEASLLGNFVLTLVSIVLEVADVGDVAHVAYLVADVLEIAEKYVESNGGTCMTQVAVAIDGGTAHVHTYMIGDDRLERLLDASQSVVNVKLLCCHN